ncbi:hypothetical protein SCOR_33850 [Sulfidibacter corallicola]
MAARHRPHFQCTRFISSQLTGFSNRPVTISCRHLTTDTGVNQANQLGCYDLLVSGWAPTRRCDLLTGSRDTDADQPIPTARSPRTPRTLLKQTCLESPNAERFVVPGRFIRRMNLSKRSMIRVPACFEDRRGSRLAGPADTSKRSTLRRCETPKSEAPIEVGALECATSGRTYLA